MHVSSISAHLHHCDREWRMLERMIGDDMFFYIVKGNGHVSIEDRVYAVRAGQCAHFQRRVRHSASHDQKSPFCVLTLHYDAAIMQSLTLAELAGFPDIFDVDGDPLLNCFFNEACEESNGNRIGRDRALEAIVIRLLLFLLRTPKYQNLMRLDYQEARHNDLLRLQPALERMASGLANPDSVGRLAQACGLSKAQFGRVFSRSLRMPPIHYIRHLRMTRACWLLRNTLQTIECIAADVGYQETSYFSRTFKNFMGTAPGNYRKSTGP